MRDHDLAWAAGLFAGEGNVGVAISRNSSGKYPYLNLQIGMYDERSIARFASIFGAAYGKVFLKHRNHWFYRCHLRARPAEQAFAAMWSYLEGTDKGDQILNQAQKLGVDDWITGVKIGDRPQLHARKRGRVSFA